jgi:FAD binding domain-containing protein
MFCIHKFRWPNIKWQSYDQAVTGQDEEIQVPVLIVGGSLVGLSTALLLAWHGVKSLVMERHSGTAIHPRAGHFNRDSGLDTLRSCAQEPPTRAGISTLWPRLETGNISVTPWIRPITMARHTSGATSASRSLSVQPEYLHRCRNSTHR